MTLPGPKPNSKSHCRSIPLLRLPQSTSPDRYREQNRDTEGERILQDAVRRSPDDASLQHALGLLMVRQRCSAQALTLLAAAACDDPNNARYAYVYTVALKDASQANAAIRR